MVFVVLLTFIVFRVWFLPGVITGGDWWPGTFIPQYELYPYAWHWIDANGFGGFTSPVGWLKFTAGLHDTLARTFGIQGKDITARFFFFYSTIAIALYSSFSLGRYAFPKMKFLFLVPFLFLFNTYILMIIAGGQMFIALSYAIAPYVPF